MVKIITVHGTFAGDPEKRDVGEKWWQRSSWFLDELKSYFAEPVEISPYHWSGSNSELERRKSGQRLSELIVGENEPPIVIGHSHGGSIVVHALSEIYSKNRSKAADTIRGVVTIGMPMILFKSSNNPLSWFNILGRIILIIGLYFGIVSLQYFLFALNSYDAGAAYGTSVRFLSASLAILGVLYLYTRRNSQRSRHYNRNILLDAYRDRAVAFNHTEDEAISALTSGVKMRPDLVSFNRVFSGLFSFFSFVTIVVFLILDVIGGHFIYTMFSVLWALIGAESLLENAQNNFLYILANVSIAILFSIGFAAFVAFISANFLTPIMSGGVIDTLRNVAFGNDVNGEKVRAIRSSIDLRKADWASLPSYVEREMLEASRLDAPEAIERLRGLLATGILLGPDGADALALAAKFDKSELIHNAYFRSPAFIQNLAGFIIDNYGVAPSARYKALASK